MSTETTGQPDTVVSDDVNLPELNTPEATAAAGDVEPKEQAPEKVFTQAEVDALIQKRLQKEERRVSRRVEAQLREQQQTAIAKTPPERDDFRDDAAFTQAQIEHIAAQKAEQLIDQRDRAAKQEQRAETFAEKAEAATERYADFHSVVSNPALPINEAMAEFIAESDHGADVAYHLGKNPGKAAQIARMSPVQAARALIGIEAEIASKPKAQPSKAPEPISPVGTRGRATTSSLPSDSDDIETWMRKERERARRPR